MDKAYYEDNHFGVHIISVERELAQSMNVDHWPKWLLNEIEWFQLEGNL